MSRLSTIDHNRDAAQMTYVYPVVSRRAGGVSVGINLSPNHACNFRCIYCQVPDLVRGTSPPIDLAQLREELDRLLFDILDGDFLERRVAEGSRTLRDVAFSGNGEPTSSPDFSAAVGVVGRVLASHGLTGTTSGTGSGGLVRLGHRGVEVTDPLPVVLISNGTLTHKPEVTEGLRKLAEINGRVWFKLDAATREGFGRVNDTPLDPSAHLERLRKTALLVPTWVQTCIFGLDGEPPTEEQRSAYVEALGRLVDDGVPLRGVLLYTVARESMQPEAARLRKLDADEMGVWAAALRDLGLEVKVSL